MPAEFALDPSVVARAAANRVVEKPPNRSRLSARTVAGFPPLSSGYLPPKHSHRGGSMIHRDAFPTASRLAIT